MDSEILWTARSQPTKMYEKILDGILILSSVLTGRHKELIITEWDVDSLGFTFRVPHSTPNQANRLLLDAQHALQSVDLGWDLSYKENAQVDWEWFVVRYKE